MTHLLGIDLGTSSVKTTIIDVAGKILATATASYPILIPQPGFAEQDPDAWWGAVCLSIREAYHLAGKPALAGIGLSGQMHGTVLLGLNLKPLAPAIIWADQRSQPQLAVFRERVGEDLLPRVGTLPATGFMGPTLLWINQHVPKLLGQTQVVLLPKDYIRFKLTSILGTDVTDASATALFDVGKRKWSSTVLNRLHLPEQIMPTVNDSAEVVGGLTASAADQLGLPVGLPVVAGVGDQVAQAIANGLLHPGQSAVTIGTGGQVFVPMDAPRVDSQLRLHTFCHAPSNRWYLLGATLSAGLSMNWLRDLLGEAENPSAFAELDRLAAELPPGANGLLFLPYLIGERTPINDPLARGTFIGLRLAHQRGHFARAIMEGVCFALRQIVETVEMSQVQVTHLLASGNGLAHPLWRQICADVLNRPLQTTHSGEQAGVGAALLAGIGTGVYSSYDEAVAAFRPTTHLTEPNPAFVPRYDALYDKYKSIYPLLKPLFHQLTDL